MTLEDKIQLLVVDFNRKFGTNPTRVFLPEAKEGKFLGLLVKQGDKLAIGVGNRILFWDSIPSAVELPLFVQNEPEDVFELIKGYTGGNLTDVLNGIADYERNKREERTKSC